MIVVPTGKKFNKAYCKTALTETFSTDSVNENVVQLSSPIGTIFGVTVVCESLGKKRGRHAVLQQ